MIYKNINKAKADEFRNKSIVALDYGDRFIGIAASDISQIIATPVTVLERNNIERDLKQIAKILESYQTKLILLGLPNNHDQATEKTTQKVKSFANILNQQLDVDIFYFDERYSSHAASRVTNQAEFKKFSRDDAHAACFVLQGFLEFLR